MPQANDLLESWCLKKFGVLGVRPVSNWLRREGFTKYDYGMRERWTKKGSTWKNLTDEQRLAIAYLMQEWGDSGYTEMYWFGEEKEPKA